MSSIDLRPIQPTYENALRVQELVLQDLVHNLGLSEERAKQLADPASDEFVTRQFDRLKRGLRLRDRVVISAYTGAWLDNSLDGILKLNEWNRADDAPFLPVHERLLSKIKSRHIGYERPDSPLGIFQLSAEHELLDDQKAVILKKLVRHAVREAREEKVPLLISAVDGDPAISILAGQGFKRTEFTGAPIADVEQVVYSRLF